MDRWTWMVVKAYIPTLVAFLVGVVSSFVIADWRENIYLAAFAGPARWIPLCAFAVAVVLATWATYRLWRAERGEGLLCGCGGLLGAERDGRHGPYRRCLACSRNVPQRHYERL